MLLLFKLGCVIWCCSFVCLLRYVLWWFWGYRIFVWWVLNLLLLLVLLLCDVCFCWRFFWLLLLCVIVVNMFVFVFLFCVVVVRDGVLCCDSLLVGRVIGLGLVWKDRGRFLEGNVGWCGCVERIDCDGELGMRRRWGWVVVVEGDEFREVLDVGCD